MKNRPLGRSGSHALWLALALGLAEGKAAAAAVEAKPDKPAAQLNPSPGEPATRTKRIRRLQSVKPALQEIIAKPQSHLPKT